jgi:putative alpha-1,2-mannosidase
MIGLPRIFTSLSADCSSGFTQGGSNADIVLVDAYIKNITTGIDWKLAYEALLSDAEVEPLNWDVEGTYISTGCCTYSLT